MAGHGEFLSIAHETIETHGGPGLLWYADQVYENFVLRIRWRVHARQDNSGVFIRCPPLEQDIRPAIERGYEIQIDERGFDPESNAEGSALHMTGAIYGVAPVATRSSRPVREWNDFEVFVRGGLIEVTLNGVTATAIRNASREPRGHIALQAHDENSRVQFRDLRVRRLED